MIRKIWLLSVVSVAITEGATSGYTEGWMGTSCFMGGNLLIQDKSECALAAGASLQSVVEVPVEQRQISIGGCFWEYTLDGSYLLKFNSYVLSPALVAYSQPLCKALGKMETDSHLRLNGSSTCIFHGEITVLSAESCQAAATDLDITSPLNVISSYEYPAGCYLDLILGGLYYNTVVLSSSSFIGSSPICARTSEETYAAPTPDRTGYIKIGGQQSCIGWGNGVIQTSDDCVRAAMTIGMNSSIRSTAESDVFSKPPGCYYDIWQGSEGLFFNNYLASTSMHIHSAPICEYTGRPRLDTDFLQSTAATSCLSVTGYKNIATSEDCLAAATALGFRYSEAWLVSKDEAFYRPGGCFVLETTVGARQKGLYFNALQGGYPGAFDVPLCAMIKEQPGYQRTELNQTCLELDMIDVGTYEECQYALTQLKFSSAVQKPPPAIATVSPKGCYLSYEGATPVSYFNNNPYATSIAYPYTASVCRRPVPYSFAIDQKSTTNDFYFGLNAWAASDETTVYDKMPGANGLRMVRWGNALLKPTGEAPIELHSDHGREKLKTFVADLYKGRECDMREYGNMLQERGAKVLVTMFGAPTTYTIDSTWNNSFVSHMLKDERLQDWAELLAESVWFVENKLGITIDYLELSNEPNGVWDTYVSPQQYVTLLKATGLALRERGVTLKFIGPGVSDFGSSVLCVDPVTNTFLDKCYMQTLLEDTEAMNMIEAFSMHPWDDVYNKKGRGPSYLDEAFLNWHHEVKIGGGSQKPLVITEWSGLNLVTMPLGGHYFDSTAAECYVEQKSSNNTKKENNIATSPLWAARAYANLLLMINNGVTDALYWMAKDITWSEGCLGLYDRAGNPSEMYKVLETFLSYWPAGVAKAIARPWPSNVPGRTEDVIVGGITDDCRMVIGVANIKDSATEVELNIVPSRSGAKVIQVTSLNNGDKVPEVVLGKQTITMSSYAVLTIVVDDEQCTKSTEEYAKQSDSESQTGYAIVLWGGLAAIALMGACYKTTKSREGKESTLYTMQASMNGEDVLETNYTNLGNEVQEVREDNSGRTALVLKLIVVIDIIIHAVLLTEGGSVSGKFGSFRADIREMGRLVTDAWVYHAVRLGLLAICYWASSTSLITKRQVFTLSRPVFLAAIALLFAKARIRIANSTGEMCWFDLDVQEGSNATSGVWFWTMIAAGVLTAATELYFVWVLGNANRTPAKPKPSLSQNSKSTMLPLDSLRFFAAVHIVLYHFHGSRNHVWDIFASWGATQLTFFFMLSGFVLSYQYGDRTIDQTDFWFKRAVRLYPLYVATCLLGVLVMPSDAFNATDTFFIFAAVQKWTGPAVNYINTPGWAVGPFLLLYSMYPSLRDIVLTVSVQKRSNVLLPLLYVLSAMAALDALNENWTGVFAPLNHVFLSAHLPSFMSGLVLGLNFLESHKEGANASPTMRDVVAVPGALLVIVAVFCTLDLSDEHGKTPFWHEWARFGMFQPLFGVLLWYGGRGHDFMSRALSWGPFVFLGKYSFTLYLLQAPLHNTFQRYLNVPYPLQNWACDAFLFMLLAAAFVVYEFFEEPARVYLLKSWRAVYPLIPNFIEKTPAAPEFVKIIGYYCAMASIFVMFTALAVFGTSTILRWEGDSYVFSMEGETLGTVITVIKWMALTSTPVAVIGLAGQVLFPPCKRKKIPSLEAMLGSDGSGSVPSFSHKLHFRIVTRGKHPLLVLENVETAARVLEACLPAEKYELEVVTDNDMQLQSRTTTPVTEIIVPHEYKCPSGAKFKARALEYAIHNSSCTPDDWIVHQDEETRFDVETVQHVYYHCAMEQKAVDDKIRKYGRIGQGIILYGVNDEIENWVTTLADSIRVADDFGKFRIQFELHEPLIGMHGSFVVASQKVEKDTTFDHGMAGSVTEDAYFALVARSLGVTFSYIDAFMYEQSPFSILDFAKQRKRWFAGLWLVAKAPLIPLKYRVGLFLLEIQWGWAPLMLPAALLVLMVKTDTSMGFRVVLALVSAYWCWAYVVGFLFTFSVRKLGAMKYLVLLWLQLVMQPFFALMEVWGVAYALVDREAFKGFHVVQKESAALKARMNERDAGEINYGDEHSAPSPPCREEEIEVELKPMAEADDDTLVVEAS
eukprot:TRINITY_DN5525_c0_g1_i1.p1 TRINITY_DN5525_c0_g1~~TRINITY_DN5525_c0_g1_i1.p1  ORF type:complete len:2108 (+),score=512.64 TRINITY_DN5525_c0_g1_i1:80-6403(+)